MGWGILYRMVADVMASVLRLPRVGQGGCVWGQDSERGANFLPKDLAVRQHQDPRREGMCGNGTSSVRAMVCLP